MWKGCLVRKTIARMLGTGRRSGPFAGVRSADRPLDSRGCRHSAGSIPEASWRSSDAGPTCAACSLTTPRRPGGPLTATVYDTGGTDTIDFRTDTGDQRIDLSAHGGGTIVLRNVDLDGLGDSDFLF